MANIPASVVKWSPVIIAFVLRVTTLLNEFHGFCKVPILTSRFQQISHCYQQRIMSPEAGHAHSVSVKHIVALYKAIIAPSTRRGNVSGVRVRVQKAEFQAPEVAKMSTVNVVPKAVPKRPHTSQNTAK